MQGILYRDDIRQVSRLLRKCDRLPCLYGVKSQYLDYLQTIVSLIESVPCFWKAPGAGRDRCGVICQYCFIPDAGTSAQKEALLKGFVPSNLLKEIMVDIFRDAVLIRKRMRKLPGQYPRKRLPVRGKKISGQRKDLLSCSGIRITINSIINTGGISDMRDDIHHPDLRT